MSTFPFIFLIFCKLFWSLSQNEPGRQDGPFVVLGHIFSNKMSIPYSSKTVQMNRVYRVIKKTLDLTLEIYFWE